MTKVIKCAHCREISNILELRKIYIDNVSCPICFNDKDIELQVSLCGHISCTECINKMIIDDPRFNEIFTFENIKVKWIWETELEQWILCKESNEWYRKNSSTNSVPYCPQGYKAIWLKAKKVSMRRWILLKN